MSITSEAMNRYVAAKGYIEAGKYIFTSPHMNTEARIANTILPMNMLAAFSLELLLKAWLLDAGRDSKAVRNFGHDIAKLYEEAKVEKLPSIALLDDLVDSLAKGHKDFTFRYLEAGTMVNTVNWKAAFPVLDALEEAVDAKIGASASKGLKPGH